MKIYPFLTVAADWPVTKPYRDGTSLDKIIEDGWSRGFLPAQTIMEAKVMGFELTEEELLTEWGKLNREMIEDSALRSNTLVPVDEIDLALAILCAHHDKEDI